MMMKVCCLLSFILCFHVCSSFMALNYNQNSYRHQINMIIKNEKGNKRGSSSSGGSGGGGGSSGGSGSGGSENISKKRMINTRSSGIGQQKTARLLRDELTEIICTCDIKAVNYPDENLLRSVSIADIEFSNDLAFAKIYLSILGNSVEKRQIYVWLCQNVGQIRYSLSQRLKNLRRLPEFKFSMIDSQSSFYLNDIMDSITEEQKKKKEEDEMMNNITNIDFEEAS